MRAHPAVRDVRRQLDAVAASADLSPEVYDDLRALLRSVPLQRRGVEWRKANILVEIVFHRHPKRVLRRLNRLRTHLETRGDLTSYDEFWAECVERLGPYTIGSAGYPLALRNQDQQGIWADVARSTAALEERGFPSFLVSGTLLGAVRDGALIGHDFDVDLAVLLPGGAPADVVQQWRDLRSSLVADGVLDGDYDARARVHTKMAATSDIEIDLFPAWATDGRVHVWPHTLGEIGVDLVLPLRRLRVAGHDLPVPCEPEAMLVVNYGPGWRSPDPAFCFDWSVARDRFPADFVDAFPGERAM